MEIEKLGSPDRKTLVILGAGASRGASFVENSTMLPPPVDRDFFQILQMSKTGRSDDGRALVDYVRDAYGPALDVGMEAVFSNLDAASTFHHEVKIDPGPQTIWPTKLVDSFRRVLPELLGETIGAAECDYHLALARRLNTIDNVVSLNYDCLIDHALCTAAGSRFAAGRGGYGVDTAMGTHEWKGTAKGRQPKPSTLSPTAALWRSSSGRHLASPSSAARRVESTMSEKSTVARVRSTGALRCPPVMKRSISSAIVPWSPNQNAWSQPGSSTKRAFGINSPSTRPASIGIESPSR